MKIGSSVKIVTKFAYQEANVKNSENAYVLDTYDTANSCSSHCHKAKPDQAVCFAAPGDEDIRHFQHDYRS